ncbi:MAG: DNA polymerase III subunit gamma/tau [Candidatus Nanosyncoccus sp. P13S_S20_bin.18.1]|nr:DNA polymerase III subunit gamma/tau [Candidatus Nanosyncoccus sp. P13S_S20_bin.18.1]
MTKALYRKYRPLKLADVVGQDDTIRQLQTQLTNQKISHGYLFVGARGCGKTSVARIFAHEINHFDYQLEDNYVDIIEIDAAVFTMVENIRELRDKAMLAPTTGKYKVYIIDEIHMLSKNAFNALLKILEEPPEHIVFIFATTNPEKIPATILSRVQIFHFKLADRSIMQPFLESICQKEGINIEKDALSLLIEQGGGSFRDSLSILDQLSNLHPDKSTLITTEEVSSALGVPKQVLIQELLASYEQENVDQIRSLVEELINQGNKAEGIATSLIKAIVQNPTAKNLHLIEKLYAVNGEFASAKLIVALILNHFKAAPVAISASSAPQIQAPKTPVTTQTPEAISAQEATKTSIATESPAAEPAAPATPVTSTTSAAPATPVNSEEPAKPSINPEIRERLVKISKSKLTEKIQERAEIQNQQIQAEAITIPEAVVSGSGDFSAKGFLENIKNIAETLFVPLNKSYFAYKSNQLEIYPSAKVWFNILNSKNNLEVLKTAINGLNIIIMNPDEHKIPSTAVDFNQFSAGKLEATPKTDDVSLSAISDIMGNIQELEDSPF